MPEFHLASFRIMSSIRPFTACILLFLSSALAAHVPAQNSTIDAVKFDALCSAFRSKLESSLAGTKIPGSTAAVVLADGRICAAAAGTANTPDHRKLTTEDPILAGSIGKTFVSALALKAVEEGKLTLDDKIGKYLGDRPWFRRLPNANNITVRMLMNHSSGIPDHVEESGFFSAAKKGSEQDVPYDYLLTFILDKKPLFAAGKGYAYADTNYILLAIIEEYVTGKTMYDEVKRRFINPLGLDHTTPSNKNTDPAVYGSYENQPVVKKGRLIINPQWEWAGGGFYSTPTDLARWATALYGGKVLEKASFEQLIGSTTVGEGKNYGLGVESLQTKWGITYGHDGEWPGYLSMMRYYPKYGMAIAVQINAGGTTEATSYTRMIAADLADIFLNEMASDKLSAEDAAKFGKQALDWLHLIDAGKLAESFDDIVADLRARYTRSNWPNALKPFREKVGMLRGRNLRSVIRTESDKITLEFSTSFSKLSSASESIVLKLEADGKWRVSTYSIH